MANGTGTANDPWQLTTPLGTSTLTMHIDEAKQVLHCQVGTTWLHYKLSALDDLHAMLTAHGDWMELGNADEKADTKPGTVEHWARSADNPVGGWYGLRNGYRGRFAAYVGATLAGKGRAEFETRGRSTWIRAI